MFACNRWKTIHSNRHFFCWLNQSTNPKDYLLAFFYFLFTFSSLIFWIHHAFVSWVFSLTCKKKTFWMIKKKEKMINKEKFLVCALNKMVITVDRCSHVTIICVIECMREHRKHNQSQCKIKIHTIFVKYRYFLTLVVYVLAILLLFRIKLSSLKWETMRIINFPIWTLIISWWTKMNFFLYQYWFMFADVDSF